VIVPDVNLLLHAYNASSLVHIEAKAWWEASLSGPESVGLAWVTVLGFIRIGTTLKAAARPLHVREACDHVRSWLARRHVAVLHPGDRHADILFDLLERLGVGGNLTTDAHLAALAIEYQAELYSTDADFARFPGLRWRNPLKR
jgi:toxin-antitoxin system PIN domain toxin